MPPFIRERWFDFQASLGVDAQLLPPALLGLRAGVQIFSFGGAFSGFSLDNIQFFTKLNLVKSLDENQVYDITPTINSRLAVFPGDTPFEAEFLLDINKGHNLTLSKITTTVHLGAHTDAPNHYAAHGEAMATRDLSYYLGLAQVIEVKSKTRVVRADLEDRAIQAPRVLFKTRSFPNPYKWNDDFVGLSKEVVEYLQKLDVRLVGIDTPSIDPADDKVLESHNAVARADMAILEGIVLDHVPEGLYQLIALPLKIEGSDASPVRAILLGM